MSRVIVPGFIEPQLPTLVDQPPEGPGWLHEVKHDGYRTLVLIDRGTVRAFTRNGHDWTDRYPRIVEAAAKLRLKSAIIDGEVVVQDARGASDFEALQSALRSPGAPLIFYAFDLLHLSGKDLRDLPLVRRRARLAKLLSDPASPLQFSDSLIGDAAAFFRACAEHKLEGMVSKLAKSPYRSGRSRSWLKTKCFAESELTLLGIDRDRKTGAQRALLAKHEGGRLVYAGPAFLALDAKGWEVLEDKFRLLGEERPAVSYLRNRDARWVKPKLNVRVKHLAGNGLLRHATVRAIA